ncbi:hypothetical protein LPB72_15350 [Hydrogenophaga crassostreae]|uniref:Tim44-like domain-containing protein n=1 Tax=Hydrogenophaga crassostreae TaxID=1763535 RepID=A0A167HJ45_9BURK|nr:hypothetical protein LPB072_05100 [Hydrogenophaga crassostreae]OAD41274.1 hypothetical protein LPB72_15350 [Hydrogenophaga crassostreae]
MVAIACVKGAWAVEKAATIAPESSATANTGSIVGLWSSIAALALLGVLVVGKMLRSRSGPGSDTRLNRENARVDPGDVQAATPRGYSSQNVGNDASARPWERQGSALDAGTAAGSQGGYSAIELQAEGTVTSVPNGFDVEAFLKASKANFVDLQAAWDRSDTASLRAMMTDGMLEQIKGQLIEREQDSVGAAHAPSQVEMLEAHLLGIEEQDEDFIASVEFSGLLREGSSIGPSPFRELWSITRPKEGGGWLVAGVQALQ